MSFMPFLGITNTASGCLVSHFLFGDHSTHGERLVKLSQFLESINSLLASSVGISRSVQHLLMISCETLDMAHN